MDGFVTLTDVGNMAPGSVKAASLEGHDFLVARVGGEYFVTDAKCPHMGGHLADGTLHGTVLTCPRHDSQFDLRDGRVVRWTNLQGATLSLAKALRHPRPLRTYAVKVEGGTLLVGPERAGSPLAAPHRATSE